MALIFDNFPNERRADEFIKFVHSQGLRAKRFQSQTQMHKAWSSLDDELADVFPFQLAGLVVTVERVVDDDERERTILESVKAYGGKYRGT